MSRFSTNETWFYRQILHLPHQFTICIFEINAHTTISNVNNFKRLPSDKCKTEKQGHLVLLLLVVQLIKIQITVWIWSKCAKCDQWPGNLRWSWCSMLVEIGQSVTGNLRGNSGGYRFHVLFITLSELISLSFSLFFSSSICAIRMRVYPSCTYIVSKCNPDFIAFHHIFVCLMRRASIEYLPIVAIHQMTNFGRCKRTLLPMLQWVSSLTENISFVTHDDNPFISRQFSNRIHAECFITDDTISNGNNFECISNLETFHHHFPALNCSTTLSVQ